MGERGGRDGEETAAAARPPARPAPARRKARGEAGPPAAAGESRPPRGKATPGERSRSGAGAGGGAGAPGDSSGGACGGDMKLLPGPGDSSGTCAGGPLEGAKRPAGGQPPAGWDMLICGGGGAAPAHGPGQPLAARVPS